MADLVNEIVADRALENIDATTTKLSLAVAAVGELADAARGVEFNFKGVDNLIAFTDMMKQAQVRMDAVADAEDGVRQATIDLGTATGAYNTTVKEQSIQLVTLKLDLQAAKDQIKTLSEAYQGGTITLDKYTNSVERATADQVRLRGAISATTKSMKDSINAAPVGSMRAMSSEITTLTNQYRRLSAAQRESAEGMAMAGKIATVTAELKTLEAVIGDNRREVGNYGKALIDTGRLAEQFGRQFTRAIGSMLIYGVLFEGLQALYEYLTKLTDAEQMAADRLKAYNEQVKDLSKSLADLKPNILSAIDFDQSKANSQVAILKDTNLTLSQRFLAYKELQGIAPNILDQLDKESFAHEVNTKRMNDQIATMTTYIQYQERIAKGREEQQKGIQAQRTNEDEQQALRKEIQARLPNSIYTRDETIESLQKKFPYTDANSPGGFNKTFTDVIHLNTLQDQKKFLDENAKSADTYLATLEKQKAMLEGNVKDKTTTGRNPLSPLTPDLNGLKAEAEAEYQLNKQRLEQSKEIEQAITGDVKQELDVRLAANLRLQAVLIQIAEQEHKRNIAIQDDNIDNYLQKQIDLMNRLQELKAGKGGAKGDARDKEVDNVQAQLEDVGAKINAAYLLKTAADEKYKTESIKIAQDSVKQIGNIYLSNEEDWLVKEKFAFGQSLSNYTSHYIDQELALKKSLDNKEISVKQYNEQIKKIQEASSEFLTQKQLEFYTGLLNSDRLTIEQAKTVQDEINKLKEKQLNGAGEDKKKTPSGALPLLESGFAEQQEAGLDHQLKSISDYSQQAIEIYQNLYASIKQMRDNQFAAEQQQIQIEERQLQLNTQQQLAAIDATTGFAIQKDNEKAKVEAQSAAQAQQLQNQSNALQLKQAKAEKEAAESGVLLSTALAIAKTLPLLSNPVTAGLGIAEIAIITGLGAAQYAAAASTPLPQFRMGTTATKTPLFIAGDGGERELIKTPTGQSWWSNDSATVYGAPIGSSVTPEHEVIKWASKTASSGEDINERGNVIMHLHEQKVHVMALAETLGMTFKEVGHGIEWAISRNRPVINNGNTQAYIDAVRASGKLQSRK